jgi:predicted AAA+ superfamily ATPase
MIITETIQMTLADFAGLSVFSGLKKQPLVKAFIKLLESTEAAIPAVLPVNANVNDRLELVRAWAGFTKTFIEHFPQHGVQCSAQSPSQNSFYDALAFLVRTADNSFTRAAESVFAGSAGSETGDITGRTDIEKLSPVLRAAAAADLDRLGRAAVFDLSQLGFHIAGLLHEIGLENAAQDIEAEARAFWAAEGTTAIKIATIEIAAGDTDSAVSGLPDLFSRSKNWSDALPEFTEYIRVHGAGDLGLYHTFFWEADQPENKNSSGKLRPVEHSDPVRLADLSGYEDQRSIVISNTLRFLEGRSANNLLLYGDRGTGKSASVKAICNEYAEKGLRLVEVRKKDLLHLPKILKILAGRVLPFIVFIDDLSFETLDDSFVSLKALLEGGVEIRPPNVVIYATSNRRHLIKERIADRPGAGNPADTEVRTFDTMQEQFSLADRFGLTVVFTSPNQDQYLSIAEFIARKRGILDPTRVSGAEGSGGSADAKAGETLRLFRENALRWERWFNGRSPRTAVQFVDWVAAGTGFPWE